MKMGSGAGCPPAPSAREELRRAHFYLLLRIAFNEFRVVLALGALELIAELVEPERLGELLLVLERLADRETQVITIDEWSGWRCQRALHPRQLFRSKPIRLEVGETPVRIPEVCPGLGSAAVGLDGRLSLSERLQPVADREVRLGVLLPPDEQIAIQGDGLLVLTDPHTGCGLQDLQRPAVGVIRQQFLHFARSFLVPVQLDQYEGIFLARHAIVGRTLHDCGEQYLCIKINLVCNPDPGQQPHGFDVVTVLEEVGADQRLGRLEIAIREQARRENDFLGHRPQGNHVARRHGSVRSLALHAVEPFEHAPASGQRVIDLHGTKEGLYRRRCLA